MRLPQQRAALLLPACVLLAPAVALASSEALLAARDGGHHHGAPMAHLNETDLLLGHEPTPPSYWSIDIDLEGDASASRHPGLMGLHVILMCLAFFVALPAGIALRSVKHAMHGVAVASFWGLCVLGCAASALYKKLTPEMYEHQVHSKHGYYTLLLAVALTSIDALGFAVRVIEYARSGEKFSPRSFWQVAVRGRRGFRAEGPEYSGLIVEDPEEFVDVDVQATPKPSSSIPLHIRRGQSIEGVQVDNFVDDDHTEQWANDVGRHVRMDSASSEQTVFGFRSPKRAHHSDETLHGHDHDELAARLSKRPSMRRLIVQAGRGLFATSERLLVFLGFVQLLSGVVVYTGGCRRNYINGCLAHLIKGGIFWCYGLVSFARFLGTFSELGWAWNSAPSRRYPSAEFVESFVIFLYGITNTWMERFGANPGDPFTTKQVQHISIAVMFWFAGLMGMGLESKTVRRWLATASVAATGRSQHPADTEREPPSYSASFNPFPALVIGVTGAAMAAHAQAYVFQVQIHMLWGNLLVAFAVLRCLTYFFLWLGPPKSIMPSRPPTEALGSFFLACGGLMFIFSTEEITLAAMRRGRDDMMMFLNAVVAITCFVFCWAFSVVAFKGWLKSRSIPRAPATPA